jgi:hypothetical protein
LIRTEERWLAIDWKNSIQKYISDGDVPSLQLPARGNKWAAIFCLETITGYYYLIISSYYLKDGKNIPVVELTEPA